MCYSFIFIFNFHFCFVSFWSIVNLLCCVSFWYTAKWFNYTFIYVWMCACMLSHFSHIWLFVTLWTVACLALLSMGPSRQEDWSGLPCSPPGDLPDPGIKPTSPVAPALQANSLPLNHWETLTFVYMYIHLFSHSFPLKFITTYWIWFPVL